MHAALKDRIKQKKKKERSCVTRIQKTSPSKLAVLGATASTKISTKILKGPESGLIAKFRI